MNTHFKPARTQTVHMVSKSYPPSRAARYVVLIDGKYYRVSGEVLDRLLAGKTPDHLEIDPIKEDE